jgi:hypothetical protein
MVVGLVLGIAGYLWGERPKKMLNVNDGTASTEIRPTPASHTLPKIIPPQINQNLGDSIWGFDAGGPASETQCLGVEFDGTYFWVSGGNSGNDPNKLYQFDADGNLVGTFDQPSSLTGWGIRDLAWDGQYIYGSGSQLVYEWDPAALTWTGNTITGPENPNRGLAYDPTTDHFFTANWSSPIYEFDRSGNIIATYPNSYSIYGIAYDDVSAGGPYLWIAAQEDNGAGGFNVIYQFDITSGQFTGVSFPVTVGDPMAYAGGICFTTDWNPTMGLLFEMLQASPNDLVIGFFVTEAAKDYLIIDLDPTPLTGPWLSTLFSDAGLVGDYTTDPAYFDSLGNYLTVWITLGMYPNNIPIDTTWGSQIETYLQNGGSLYLEGGDCFYYDPTQGAWDPNDWTGTVALDDGDPDLGPINGISNNLIPDVAGYTWDYTGENSWVDHIEANTSPPNGGVAENVLEDADNAYYTGVAYNQGTWRTFASSGELGGYVSALEIEPETLAMWIMNYLQYGPPVHDVGVTAITEPSAPFPVGGTVTPRVEVKNFGDFTEPSFDVTLEIYPPGGGAPVYTDVQTVTNLAPGATQEVSFTDWTADTGGTYSLVAYTMLSGDADPSNDTATSSVLVYEFMYDYLVIDLDPTPISGNPINNFLSGVGLNGTLTYSPSYLDSLLLYRSVWLCLGMFPNNYVLSDNEVSKLQAYLEAGGMAYVEGGDCWGFDASRYQLCPLFGIDPTCTNDGGADLYQVQGVSNSFLPSVAGETWTYTGENSWVDELCLYTVPPYGGTAEIYLRNPSNFDNVGVLYDQGTWKGVAHSFESGGLVGTRTVPLDSLYMWLARDFFQIVGVKEGDIVTGGKTFFLYPANPNPSRGDVSFTFSIPSKGDVSLKIYDATGRYVTTVASGVFDAGVHTVRWNGRDSKGRRVSQGIYFYTLESGNYRSTKKLIILR